MSDTSPRIDLSVIWNRLSEKETVPFCSGMVIPTADTDDHDVFPSADRLFCQILVYEQSHGSRHITVSARDGAIQAC
ncbi:hypothetical protein [Labrenzia sp. VG12]|uniref:hypothetical protein n=1 Tax=Labrenzia sp. VG12 TaxID=2021862 RepID=UPI000B8BFC03|nr:hypothetical protein [Labrenzia sp. VG12]ASP33665.1 hypothetical protein CHH27_10745 [Labrenzia sp. VG12]